MNKVIGGVLAVGQHVCTVLAIVISIYLFYRWNVAREANPSDQNPFNPWWPGLVLFGLSAVFKLARKGLATDKRP